MKEHLNTLFAASFALLLSACLGSWSSVDWTAGTWTEGEFAAGSNDDECGIVAVLSGLDSPLQYKLGPKSDDIGLRLSDDWDDEGLSDELIASIQSNLWDGSLCREPEGDPSFSCSFPLHELHKPKWKSTLKDSFCPESTGMTLQHGWTEGLVINENEIFLEHRITLECDSPAVRCDSGYVSRMHAGELDGS